MNIILNGKKIEGEEGKTILEICANQGINIPTLCYHKNLPPESRCRICLVDLNGKLVTSCSTKPKEGDKILTKTRRVLKARRINMELMSPGIDIKKLGKDFEAKKIYEEVGVDNERFKSKRKIYKEVGLDNERFKSKRNYLPDLGDSLVRDNNKCINCGKCVQVCSQIQQIYAIDFASRAHNEHVTPYCEKNLKDIACIRCGQCLINCPVGAITEVSHLKEVEAALNNNNKHVIAQTAPSVRAALGELFDMKIGTLVTGKMVTALKDCGFDKVFDVNLGADMTIMEESAEQIKRIESK